MILREADRDPMPIVAKRHGISEQTIYTWRKRFGTFQADDVRRLKQLETENARLKKRIATGRPRPQAPTGANQVWSYDFVFDWCANGQRLKCLTVTDEWTKEGLAIEVDGRIRSPRVIEVLSRLVSERGAPLYLRSDNGPEFVARALLAWIVEQGIEIVLIDPGKPWQNGTTESFNG